MHPTPAALTLSPLDSTSATGVAADALTLASMGVYPLCVATEVFHRDTARVDARLALEAEWVVDQARLVLEDIPVKALKLVLPGAVEQVSALAALLSDYAELPMVLEIPGDAAHAEEAEDEHLAATLELLLPQSTVVVVEAAAARGVLAAGLEDEDAELDAVQMAEVFGEAGAAYVLMLGAGGGGVQQVHTLHDENGVIQRSSFAGTAAGALGFASTVAAALTAALALGADVPEAVGEALRYAHGADDHPLRMGMGRPLPDRMFWARLREGAR